MTLPKEASETSPAHGRASSTVPPACSPSCTATLQAANSEMTRLRTENEKLHPQTSPEDESDRAASETDEAAMFIDEDQPPPKEEDQPTHVPPPPSTLRPRGGVKQLSVPGAFSMGGLDQKLSTGLFAQRLATGSSPQNHPPAPSSTGLFSPAPSGTTPVPSLAPSNQTPLTKDNAPKTRSSGNVDLESGVSGETNVKVTETTTVHNLSGELNALRGGSLVKSLSSKDPPPPPVLRLDLLHDTEEHSGDSTVKRTEAANKIPPGVWRDASSGTPKMEEGMKTLALMTTEAPDLLRGEEDHWVRGDSGVASPPSRRGEMVYSSDIDSETSSEEELVSYEGGGGSTSDLMDGLRLFRELVARSREISKLREKSSLAEERRGSTSSLKTALDGAAGNVASKRNKIELESMTQELNLLRVAKVELQAKIDQMNRQLHDSKNSSTETMRQLDSEHSRKIEEMEAEYKRKEAELAAHYSAREQELEELKQQIEEFRVMAYDEKASHLTEFMMGELERLVSVYEETERGFEALQGKIDEGERQLARIRNAGEGYLATLALVTKEKEEVARQRNAMVLMVFLSALWLNEKTRRVEQREVDLVAREQSLDAWNDALAQQQILLHHDTTIVTTEIVITAIMQREERIRWKNKLKEQKAERRAEAEEVDRQRKKLLHERDQLRQEQQLALTNLQREQQKTAEQCAAALRKEEMEREKNLALKKKVEAIREEAKKKFTEAECKLQEVETRIAAEQKLREEVVREQQKHEDMTKLFESSANHVRRTLPSLNDALRQSARVFNPKVINEVDNAAADASPGDDFGFRAFPADLAMAIAKELSAVSGHFARVKETLTDAEYSGKSLAEALNLFQKKADALKASLKKTQEDLEATKKKVTDANSDLAKAKSEHEQRSAELKKLTAELAKARKDVEEAVKKREAAQQSLDTVTKEGERQRNLEEESRTRLKEVEAEKERAEMELKTLKDTMQQQRTELTIASARVASLHREKYEMEINLNDLKTKYEAVQAKVCEADAKLTVVMDRLAHHTNNEDIDKEISEKKASLEELDKGIRKKMVCYQRLVGSIEKAREALNCSDNECRTRELPSNP